MYDDLDFGRTPQPTTPSGQGQGQGEGEGELLKRKDYIESDVGARSHPNRTYFFKSHDLEQIIATCSNKLESDPGNDKALFLRGSSFMKRNQYQAAVDDFTVLIQLLPPPVSGAGVCGSLLPGETAYTVSTGGDNNSSGDAAVSAAQQQFQDAHYARGVALSRLDRPEAAIADFTVVLGAAPDHVNASFARAACYNSVGKFSEAITDYNFALLKDQSGSAGGGGRGARSRSDSSTVGGSRSPVRSTRRGPGSSAAFGSGAETLGTSARAVESGLSHAQSSAVLSPESTGALASGRTANSASGAAGTSEEHHAKGYQLRKQGDFQAAIAEYSTAIALDANNFKAWFNRGFAHDKLGLYDKAIADYSRALLVDPANAYAYYNRGISYDRIGAYEYACEDFRAAIRYAPDNADFYHNKAFCLRKMGRLAEAIDDYGHALRLNPRHFKALSNRGYCHERLGRLELALADYTAALAIQATHYGALVSRSAIYEKMGRHLEAVADITAAVQCLGDSGGSNQGANRTGGPSPAPGDQQGQGQVGALLVSRARLYEKAAGQQPDALALAIRDYSTVLEGATSTGAADVPSLLYARALCHKTLKQYAPAIADFSAAVDIFAETEAGAGAGGGSVGTAAAGGGDTVTDATLLLCLMHRGYCYRRTERFALAAQDYTGIIQEATAASGRSSTSPALGQSAFSAFSPPKQLAPSVVRAYNNRAYCHAKLGSYQAAVDDYTVVVQNDPGNSHAYHNRGK